MADGQTGEGPADRTGPHWTVYATFVLTAVLVIVGSVPYITHTSVSWFEAAIAALTVGAVLELLLAVGVLRHRQDTKSNGRTPHQDVKTPVVSAELLNRWKTMRDRIWIAFTTRDRPGSMLMAEAGILGLMNGQRNAGHLSDEEKGYLDRAFSAKGAYGWLVAHTALGWALYNLENYAPHDSVAFGAAMETIQTVATEGRNAADEWVDLIRQAGVAKLGTQARDEWGRFRDPANLTLNDLNTLVADTYREAKVGIPYRFELIRDF